MNRVSPAPLSADERTYIRQEIAWTAEGVEALARLQAAQRNGEQAHFRKRGELPAWRAQTRDR
jgi:hypothetical protein